MLKCFLYVSVSCLEDREQQIVDLVQKARARNEANDVTGALIFSGVRFAQYLEGPSERLREIVSSILDDRRHTHVTTLRDCEVEDRQFGDWALCYSGPSFYIDRHIKSLIDAQRGTPQTAVRTDQLLRLMQSLREARVTPSARSRKAVSDYTF